MNNFGYGNQMSLSSSVIQYINNLTPADWAFLTSIDQSLSKLSTPTFVRVNAGQFLANSTSGNCNLPGLWLRHNQSGTLHESLIVSNRGVSAGGLYFYETAGNGATQDPIGCITQTRSGSEGNVSWGSSWVAATGGTYGTYIGFRAGESITDNNANPETSRVCVGACAGFYPTKFNSSVAVGTNAAFGNSATSGGSNNVFVGTSSGYGITTAYDNCGIGYKSLYGLTSGYGNCCIGKDTGKHISTGSNNVLVGSDCGTALTIGTCNVLLGSNCGTGLTTGNFNFCAGPNAGSQLTTTDDSIFIGQNAGKVCTVGDNIAIGRLAGYTTSSGTLNCFLGCSAGYSNTIGNNNTFLGSDAGYSNSVGSNNCYIGSYAGQLSTGSNSIAMGYQASAGTGCVAIGYLTSVNGADSIAIGNNAHATGTNCISMGNGADSFDNGTAIGYQTYAHTGGTAIGYQSSADADNCISIGVGAKSGFDTIGNDICIGHYAGTGSAAGHYNILMGDSARSDGSRNIAIGFGAIAVGESVAIGSYNGGNVRAAGDGVVIGNYSVAGVGSVGSVIVGGHCATTGSYTYTIGNGIHNDTQYRVAIGNGTGANQCIYADTHGAGTWASGSDERLKKDIADCTVGLDFVKKLRPVTYKWLDNSTDKTYYGFTYQQVKQCLEEENITNFDDLVETNSEGYGSLAMGALVPVLVKAIKDLEIKVNALQTIVDSIIPI